jgi:hypothetical protein
VEVAIVTFWVDDAGLDVSGLRKSGEIDLGLEWEARANSHALG